MKQLTTKERVLLSKILNCDCSYLENCTEEEFQIYQTLKEKIEDY